MISFSHCFADWFQSVTKHARKGSKFDMEETYTPVDGTYYGFPLYNLYYDRQFEILLAYKSSGLLSNI